MGAGEYWNPKTETLGRDELEALQLVKLRRLCEWAAARSPFYQRSFRAAGFEPSQLRSLDDLRRLPMLTREEWMASRVSMGSRRRSSRVLSRPGSNPASRKDRW